MKTTIYCPKYLYTDGTFLENMALAVRDDTIVKVGSVKEVTTEYPDSEPVDGWKNLIMAPGCVNVHNHSFQSLLRGIACDRPFLEWRENALYKYSPKLMWDEIYVGALFSFAEMMKYGTTTVTDFFYLHNEGIHSDEAIIQAAKDIGIRLVLSRTMYDWNGAPKGYCETVEEAVRNTEYLYDKYKDNKMVSIIPAPHSLHAASPEMIIAGAEFAEKHDTNFHIHVAEEMFEVNEVREKHNGLSTIEYLNELGVVNERMVIVHGVYLKENEIELMGKKGVKLAYCPSSNMFLADGITDIPSMRKNNILIGLGSDGACSNNRNSIFEEIRMTALLQKANTCNAMCLNFKDVYEMGTKNGADILGIKAGRLEEGYKADFIGISSEELSMQPISSSAEQLLPNIVYSMQPSAVKKVVVAGSETVNDGQFVNIQEKEIISMIEKVMHKLEK